MRARRALPYIVAILLALIAFGVVSVTKPFAQEEAPPPEGGEGGEAGAPAPGAPSGAGFGWSESAMPADLLMTYGEFLAAEGQAPSPIPEFYLAEDNGNPKRYTRNQWYALTRIYEDRPFLLESKPVGSPGGELWNQVYEEAAVKHNEVNAIWTLWKDAASHFWCEVGYPRIGPQLLRYDWQRKSIQNPDGTVRWGRWEATLPDSFTILVPVVMHVKESSRRSFGQRFYNTMKKFDNVGDGRSAFRFVTFEGGHYRPHTFHLSNEAVTVWNDLWTRLEVQLRLFDPKNVEIARASQPAGITPGLFTQLLHPPVIYYEPRYRLLLPKEDDKFKGGRLNLEGKEGWYFEFNFTLTRDQLKAVNDAEARVIIDGGPPERMMTIAGGAGAAGAAPAGGAAAGGGEGAGEAAGGEGGTGGEGQ